jgi:hypothetical protein
LDKNYLKIKYLLYIIKIYMNFTCEICNYSTKRKYNLYNHLKTKKHLKNIDKFQTNKKYICECGKIYKYHSGLWRHKKKLFT